MTRRTELNLIYEGINITKDVKGYLLGWEVNDNLGGQSDDISVTLRDDADIWISDWFPEKGATLEAEVIQYSSSNSAGQLQLGTFEIDEPEFEGPPSTVKLKGLSVPPSTSLREYKNRAWEETNLKVIANDIAQEAGLHLFWDSDEVPNYDRQDQSDETDLAFLLKLCNNAGLALKITNKKIVIFDEKKYEAQDPVETFCKRPKEGQKGVKSYRFRTSLTDVYHSCKVDYHDSKTKTHITHTFTPPKPPNTKRVLHVNEKVTSIAEAERLAIKQLRQKNKHEVQGTLTIHGNIRYAAGQTIMIDGFGKLNGKYLITKVKYSQNSGFEMQLEIRKCLEGY